MKIQEGANNDKIGVEIHSNKSTMVNLIVVKDKKAINCLSTEMTSGNTTLYKYLFEGIKEKLNIFNVLTKQIKEDIKDNVSSIKPSLNIIQSYYLRYLDGKLTEKVFIEQISRIFKAVREAVFYRKDGKICCYKDGKERLKKATDELFIRLGELSKQERFAIVGREITNPLKKRGAPPLIPEVTNAVNKVLSNELISYITQKISINARHLLYILYEIRNQEAKEAKEVKGGFKISEKELAILLGFSYSAKDQRKHARSKIDSAARELDKRIEIKDPKTGAYIKGRIISFNISKAGRTAEIYYDVSFTHPVWQNNFIKINTKTLTKTNEALKGITHQPTRDKTLETAELIAINSAEGKKDYTLDDAPLYELSGWKQKERREKIVEKLVIENKEIGLVGKKIVVLNKKDKK